MRPAVPQSQSATPVTPHITSATLEDGASGALPARCAASQVHAAILEVLGGQEMVVYDGEVCLGAAAVAAPGESLAQAGEHLPPAWNHSDSVHVDVLRQYHDGGSGAARLQAGAA